MICQVRLFCYRFLSFFLYSYYNYCPLPGVVVGLLLILGGLSVAIVAIVGFLIVGRIVRLLIHIFWSFLVVFCVLFDIVH